MKRYLLVKMAKSCSYSLRILSERVPKRINDCTLGRISHLAVKCIYVKVNKR